MRQRPCQAGHELICCDGVAERGPAASLELAGDAQGARDAEAAAREAILLAARKDLPGRPLVNEAGLVEGDDAVAAGGVLHRVRHLDERDAPLALRDVSFRLPQGALTALIGRTGSGKSTTVELACALKVPNAGDVRVRGVDTADLDRRASIRSAIGYVGQFPERQLFAETVFEDVAFGPRNLGLTETEVDRRVRAALAAVGIEPTGELLARSPFALSGGQQRCVAIAGVLAMETPLLFLDEPMAGLDPRGRSRMRRLIRDLKGRGVTILLVTHSMEDVADLAELAVALDRGEVAGVGAPRELFLGDARRLPGTPAALTFARALEAAGARLDTLPITLDDLVEEVLHGRSR